MTSYVTASTRIALPFGVGVTTSVETAALLSKKALMRPMVAQRNERAASLEKCWKTALTKLAGAAGDVGNTSVMGVNIENTARHPSTIGVAVNVGCCGRTVRGTSFSIKI